MTPESCQVEGFSPPPLPEQQPLAGDCSTMVAAVGGAQQLLVAQDDA
ncbi:hypothetical protein ACU8V3_02350 [Cobetia marina]